MILFGDKKLRENFFLEQLDKITFRLRFYRTLKDALRETAPLICEAFEASSMAVWFIEPDGERLRLEFSWHLPKELVEYFQKPEHYPKKGEGIVGKAFQEQKLVIVHDFSKPKNIPEKWKKPLEQHIQGIEILLSQPLFAEDGQLVGVFNLYFKKNKKIRDRELLSIKVISNSIGAVIEAQDVYQYLQENRNILKSERDQLAKLYQVVQHIGVQKQANLQHIITTLAETVGNALGAKGIGIWKANNEKTYLQVFAHAGISDRYARYFDANPYPIRKDQTAILVRAFLEQELKFTKNLWDDGQQTQKTIPEDVQKMLRLENVVSVASAPLVVKNEIFGVLNFYFSETHTYKSSEQYILQLTANIIAFVVGNIQYRDQLKSARQIAEQEQQKTKTIIEKLSDGLIVINNDQKIGLLNKQAEVLLGISSKTLIGQNIRSLKSIKTTHPIIHMLAAANQKEVFRKEVTLSKNKTGEVTTTLFRITEKESGLLVVIHDITREKRVERLKTEFVSLAAHQLRTPTSAIKWALQILLEEDAGKLKKEQKELMQKTYQSNERVIALINDLLNVSRIEEGKLTYQNSLVQIDILLHEQKNLYSDMAKRKNLTLTYKKPKEKLPSILVDKEKIQLAIQNLLENALLYTPPQGMVEISSSSNEKEVTVAIRDTGIGIPEQEKDIMFQKFSRASNAKKLDTTGSGLGLFIVKNIIKAHNGKIWFESTEGKGTTFFFTLPFKSK